LRARVGVEGGVAPELSGLGLNGVNGEIVGAIVGAIAGETSPLAVGMLGVTVCDRDRVRGRSCEAIVDAIDCHGQVVVGELVRGIGCDRGGELVLERGGELVRGGVLELVPVDVGELVRGIGRGAGGVSTGAGGASSFGSGGSGVGVRKPRSPNGYGGRSGSGLGTLRRWR